MIRKRILLAEDHVEIRKIIGLVVADEEFELLEASDGLEALESAKQHKPHLLLLDLGLPDLDGIEVCRRLRADPDLSGMKILALTAMTGPSEKGRALAAGVDGYITKPFSPNALLDSVRQMMGLPEPLGPLLGYASQSEADHEGVPTFR